MWDTLLYVLLAPPLPTPSCRIRRQTRPSTIAAYPATWMIMTGCVMLLQSVYHGASPVYPFPTLSATITHIKGCSLLAYERILVLDDMVVLNTGTLVQYQVLKARTVRDMLDARSPETQVGVGEEPMMTSEEMETFFDAYSTLPIELGETFFDPIEEE
jgi:hypothetical protein